VLPVAKTHKPPVPSQDRVECHDGCDLRQYASTELLALRRETSALVVGQPNAPSPQLRSEDTVLFDQVLDDSLLVEVDPSSEGHEQQSERVEIGRHQPILQCLISGPCPEYGLGRVFRHYGVSGRRSR
jgi:hypothetical protein